MAHYGDRGEADTYHAERGNTAWTGADNLKDEALTRASDYIDQMYQYRRKSMKWVSMFLGTPVDEPQDRQFPRDNIVMENGTNLGDSVTPDAIEHATYEAALLEIATPGILKPVYTPTETQGAVIQETVGPLTVKYDGISHEMPGFEQRPPNMPVVFAVERLVAPYIKAVASCYPAVRTV